MSYLECCNKYKDHVFVFGANLAGRHGKGASLHAKQYHGASVGVIGPSGYSYGIPTKDEKIRTLPLSRIAPFVYGFINYARENKQLNFYVTRIGCGLAGYKDADIAPMFKDAPVNCVLPKGWQK